MVQFRLNSGVYQPWLDCKLVTREINRGSTLFVCLWLTAIKKLISQIFEPQPTVWDDTERTGRVDRLNKFVSLVLSAKLRVNWSSLRPISQTEIADLCLQINSMGRYRANWASWWPYSLCAWAALCLRVDKNASQSVLLACWDLSLLSHD